MCRAYLVEKTQFIIFHSSLFIALSVQHSPALLGRAGYLVGKSIHCHRSMLFIVIIVIIIHCHHRSLVLASWSWLSCVDSRTVEVALTGGVKLRCVDSREVEVALTIVKFPWGLCRKTLNGSINDRYNVAPACRAEVGHSRQLQVSQIYLYRVVSSLGLPSNIRNKKWFKNRTW